MCPVLTTETTNFQLFFCLFYFPPPPKYFEAKLWYISMSPMTAPVHSSNRPHFKKSHHILFLHSGAQMTAPSYHCRPTAVLSWCLKSTLLCLAV